MIQSSSGNVNECIGLHSRGFISIYGQHGKVLFGQKANIMPFTIIQPWTCNYKNIQIFERIEAILQDLIKLPIDVSEYETKSLCQTLNTFK